MSDSNRVAWTEGLFLRPQHFQQLERSFEKLIAGTRDYAAPYDFGFARLEIDQELTQLGKISLAIAQGIMPDGTAFDIPHNADIPTPLNIPDGARDVIVYLVLPLRRPNMPSMGLERNANNALVRYWSADAEARDAVAELDSVVEMKVARLNLSLRLAPDLSPAYAHLAVAKIIEKRPDGRIVFDEQFYPTVLNCRASTKLFDCVKEVYGHLRHRAQVLAERVSQPSTQGVAEFADFLLLQVCNRYLPLFAHFENRSVLHPEMLYQTLLTLAGELGTFTSKDRRAAEFEPYRHDTLWETIQPVVREIVRSLTAIMESSAEAIALENRGRYYVARFKDGEIVRNAVFVISANAQLAAEILRVRLPREAQIGSAERIKALVDSLLPGITLRPLPVAPRQIPYRAGHTYFELEKTRGSNDGVDHWKEVESTRMCIMHVAGDFPELSLELWAIRGGK